MFEQGYLPLGIQAPPPPPISRALYVAIMYVMLGYVPTRENFPLHHWVGPNSQLHELTCCKRQISVVTLMLQTNMMQ